MSARRRWSLLLTIVLVACAPGRPFDRPDVQIAAVIAGSCGGFADSTSAYVSSGDLGPSETTPPLVVCVRVNGAGRGTLRVHSIDVVESESGCSPDEAAHDSTCGHGPGELGAAVVQRITLNRRCDPTHVEPATTRLPDAPFGGEPGRGVRITSDPRPGRVICVALALHSSNDPARFVPAQSDELEWRYRFTFDATY